jgi:hypothetical protein
MSEIHEVITVLCPFEDVPRAAAAYLATLPVEDGKHVVMLHVAVGDLVVQRRADLTLRHARAYPGYEVMDIEWQPHDGGPYPLFRGTLSAEDVTGNYCRLDLDGAYAPPLGLAGVVFDAVVGHRIAEAAARELLSDIRIGLELAFHAGATPA